ncbi:hypothetical protein PTKIN_Ptkin10aG0077400 [Pterospermum kingtungense]
MNEVEGDRAKVDNERVVVEELKVEVERGIDCVEGYEGSDGKKNSVRVDMNKVEGDGLKLDNERVEGMGHVVVEDEGAEVEGLDEGVSQVSVGEGGSARVDMEKVYDDGHELDDENEYLVRVRYQADEEGDEELEAAREKVRQYKNNPSTVKDNKKSADLLENIHLDKCAVGAGGNENDQGCDIEECTCDNWSVVGSDNEEGKVFKDGNQFREAIQKYSMVERRQLTFVRNEPYKIRVKCTAAAKCPWYIFASYGKKARGMQVKTFIEEHSCAVSFKNKLVDTKMIFEQLETDIKNQPKMKLKELQLRIKEKCHVDVNMTRCKRAKCMVKQKLASNYEEEFTVLRDYAEELLDKNPGSTVILNVDRVTPNSPPMFKRIYICFDALKKGWKKGCRPWIGVDGCFLKGPY